MGALPSYILYFLLLVGPLVLIHEFGHFAVAKLCGIKVVRFSFGFGPRLIGFRAGDTDYRLSLLPLGGYVKMAGDNPAEEIAPEDRPHAFLSAAPWKRALIAFAGPAMNLVLPVIVFFCLAVFTAHEGLAPTVGVVMPDSPAAQAGILPGDRITAVNGKKVQAFDDLRDLIAEENGTLRITVLRNGGSLDLSMTPQLLEETDDLETTHRKVIGIRPLAPPATIGILDPAAPAAVAGLRTFDRILEVGSTPVDDQLELRKALAVALESGQPIAIKAARGVALGYRGLGPGVPKIIVARLPGGTPVSAGPWGLDSADLFVRWVIPGSPADRAGIHAGDRLLTLDGVPLENWWGYEDRLRKKQEAPFLLTAESPGAAPREVTLSQQLLDLGESPVTGVEVKALGAGLLHDGESLLPTDEISPRDWVQPTLLTEKETFSVGEAWSKSLRATGEVIRKEVLGIVRIFQGRVSVKKLGGPLMIADVARQAAANGLAAFLFMMTLVSVNLGLVNLIPLPVLDGGHIATAAVEAVQRKPLSRRAYELTNAFGFVLLLALMAFVLINDIIQKRGPGLFP
jgi:regulator of sigma E protease